MKRIILVFVVLCIILPVSAQETLLEFMKLEKNIVAFEKIPGNNFFPETYEIKVKQALDPKDTTLGFFEQRVFVAVKNNTNPVVFITEGYGANYAANKNYINELSPMLNANQICVEHRYFGESWPDSINWDYLTAKNAAADHHKIVELFRPFFTGKWISTGISKGGQTAVYHRTWYPNDVDATVAYVCPLNFNMEDGRHEPFIKKVPGTKAIRKKIKTFQVQVLKTRDDILPLLKTYTDEKKYTYRISLNEVLDYCVLEYPFALWQWGKYIDEIPEKNASAQQLFAHLVKVSGPSYFALQPMENIKSFFIQAARELGYYGYNEKGLTKYLSIHSSENYLERIFLPPGLKINYTKNTAQEVDQFIQNTNKQILFIYGEFDPWTASAFIVPKKNNILKIIKPGGSHSTRINNLPDYQKNSVKEKLEDWLNLELKLN